VIWNFNVVGTAAVLGFNRQPLVLITSDALEGCFSLGALQLEAYDAWSAGSIWCFSLW
jgi:hypothetical protein